MAERTKLITSNILMFSNMRYAVCNMVHVFNSNRNSKVDDLAN